MYTNGNDALLWNARLDNNSMQYCICMKAIPKGGTINNKNEKITVTGADEVVFIISAPIPTISPTTTPILTTLQHMWVLTLLTLQNRG